MSEPTNPNAAGLREAVAPIVDQFIPSRGHPDHAHTVNRILTAITPFILPTSKPEAGEHQGKQEATGTPRTDAVVELEGEYTAIRQIVAADFARTLERELAEAKANGFLMAGCVLKRGEPLAYEALAGEIAALRAQLAAVTKELSEAKEATAHNLDASDRYAKGLADALGREDALKADLATLSAKLSAAEKERDDEKAAIRSTLVTTSREAHDLRAQLQQAQAELKACHAGIAKVNTALGAKSPADRSGESIFVAAVAELDRLTTILAALPEVEATLNYYATAPWGAHTKAKNTLAKLQSLTTPRQLPMNPTPHAILLAALLLLASPVVALAWLLDCVFGNHRRPY